MTGTRHLVVQIKHIFFPKYLWLSKILNYIIFFTVLIFWTLFFEATMGQTHTWVSWPKLQELALTQITNVAYFASHSSQSLNPNKSILDC